MTRPKSRAKDDWDDERVDLRIQLHMLEEKGVHAGPQHLELTTRIKELSRLISESVGAREARG